MPNFQWLSCSPFAPYKNQWQVLEPIQWRRRAAGFLFSSQNFVDMRLALLVLAHPKLLVFSLEKPKLRRGSTIIARTMYGHCVAYCRILPSTVVQQPEPTGAGQQRCCQLWLPQELHPSLQVCPLSAPPTEYTAAGQQSSLHCSQETRGPSMAHFIYNGFIPRAQYFNICWFFSSAETWTRSIISFLPSEAPKPKIEMWSYW